MEHFAWATPEALGRLTERQVDEYLLHARDRETGQIKRPDAPAAGMGEEERVLAFLAIAKSMRLPPDQIEAKVAEIRAAYARRRGEDAPPAPTREELAAAARAARQARKAGPRRPRTQFPPRKPPGKKKKGE